MDLPVRRVIAAVDVAELLPQVFLRVAVLGARHRRRRLDADPLRPRRSLLLFGDLLLLAHALQDDEAALTRGVEMVPRRVRGGGADDAGDQRGFGQRQLRRRLAQHLPRHRLDAVDAAAEEHPIQIQLEDLLLAEERFEHDGECRFLGLAAEGLRVGQEQRARQLLGDGAAALRPVGSEVREHGPSQADRIDARDGGSSGDPRRR